MDMKDCPDKWETSVGVNIANQNKTLVGMYLKDEEIVESTPLSSFSDKKPDINRLSEMENALSDVSVTYVKTHDLKSEVCFVNPTCEHRSSQPEEITGDKKGKVLKEEEEKEKEQLHEDEESMIGKVHEEDEEEEEEEERSRKSEVNDGMVRHKEPVRRPMNAFLIFCKRHRSIVRNQNVHLDNRSVTRILGDLWANLPPLDKALYINLAKEYKEAFMKANPDYKWYNPEKHVAASVVRPSTRPSNAYTVYHGQQPRTVDAITPGKLADPSCMGGLSLLLMAGQQDQPVADEAGIEARRHSDTSTIDDVSAIAADVAEESAGTDVMTPLLQLAEMCSSRLEVGPANQKIASGSLPPVGEPTSEPMDLSYKVHSTDSADQVLDLTVPSTKFTQLRITEPSVQLTAATAAAAAAGPVGGGDGEITGQTTGDVNVQTCSEMSDGVDGKTDRSGMGTGVQHSDMLPQQVDSRTKQADGQMDSQLVSGQASDVADKRNETTSEVRRKKATAATVHKNSMCLQSAAIAACSRIVVDQVVDALYLRRKDVSASNCVKGDAIAQKNETAAEKSKIRVNISEHKNMCDKVSDSANKIGAGLGRHTTLKSGGSGGDRAGKPLTFADIQETLIRHAMKQSSVTGRSGKKTAAAAAAAATGGGEKKLCGKGHVALRTSAAKAEKKTTADTSLSTSGSCVSLPVTSRGAASSPVADIYTFTETVEELPPKQRPSKPIKTTDTSVAAAASLPPPNVSKVTCDKQSLYPRSDVSLVKARTYEGVDGNGEDGKVMNTGDVEKVVKEGKKAKRKKKKNSNDVDMKCNKPANATVGEPEVAVRCQSDNPDCKQTMCNYGDDVATTKVDSSGDLNSPGSSPRSDVQDLGSDVLSQEVAGEVVGGWVRKSQRCNRGKRYQELITQGLIQPSRANARRFDQSDENTTRQEAVGMATVTKRNRKRTVSETATDEDGQKRYSTGDFDLSACIASLPVCDLKSSTKHSKPRSRHNSEQSAARKEAPAHSSQEFNADLNIAELLQMTRQQLPSTDAEPAVATGSRKRKARKFAILHLHQSSPLDAADQPAEKASRYDLSLPCNPSEPKQEKNNNNNKPSESSPVSDDITPLTTIISGRISLTSLADESSHPSHGVPAPVISAPAALTSHCQLTPLVTHSSDTLVTF